jgi:hypothetical protein
MEIGFYQEYVCSSSCLETKLLTISGYGPLTLHWGAGPMWTSPLITSVLGCVAATAKIAEEWDRQG